MVISMLLKEFHTVSLL